MSTDKAVPVFAVGARARKEVQKALQKSTDPSATISNYQKSRSLHAQFAKAFGTVPQYEVDESKGDKKKVMEENVETLDTDSVLQFLGHLGVSQYQVHKRVGDTLQKQLEDELRKTTAQEPLLQLLQNCWPYATVNPEFRPILWSVLKQLGRNTPVAFLRAVAERNKKTGQIKHLDVFRPLPPLLKRLVWETDWTDRVSAEAENDLNGTNPKQYRQLIQSTLLYETVQPHIQSYCSTLALAEAADKLFVHSNSERRLVTSHRRALVSSSSVVDTSGVSSLATATTTTTATSSLLLVKTSASVAGTSTPATTATAVDDSKTSSSSSSPYSQSGRAVSHLRNMLSDTTFGGSASYRPKLLHALLSMLMAEHGSHVNSSSNGTSTSGKFLAGSGHLHCTLVADVLLSTSGPLPKQYSHVHSLARVLDDAVTRGLFTDKDLIQAQEALKEIFQSEPDVDVGTEGRDDQDAGKEKKKANGDEADKGKKKIQLNISLIRQLNQIITTALTQMKEEDANSIFLNMVSDDVAPGYSKIIKKPMAISKMQEKVEHNDYHTLDTWEADVRLMFKNCIKYNKGPQGVWFRGEAERQGKIFTDEVLPQAKRLWVAELAKRNPQENDAFKRKLDDESAPKIEPFSAARKIRKLEDKSEYRLSMVALATMLLADPFVVRLLLDRVLRSLRTDVLKGEAVPAAHVAVPSIMQLLSLAQWSPQICATRGNRFVIPDAGVEPPKYVGSIEDLVPYASLRRYMPVMVHLLLDADLEKRLAIGGDLHSVANSSLSRPKPTPIIVDDKFNPSSQVSVALVEGTFIQTCLPGYSQDVSLARTFVKCSNALLGLSGGNVWDERAFYKCLVPAILRHKARLNKTVRDAIVATWMDWLKAPSNANEGSNSTTRKKKKRGGGSMKSPAHEYLILLLNEWASGFGNLLMPRDLLLKVATEVAQTANETERSTEDKLSALWQEDESSDFAPVKAQYERLLSLLPESHSTQWKTTMGIEDSTADRKDTEDQADSDKVKKEENGGTGDDDIMKVEKTG